MHGWPVREMKYSYFCMARGTPYNKRPGSRLTYNSSASSVVTSFVSFSAVLIQHHLKYLLEDTIDAQTKWKFIGLYLGLPPPTLTAIGKKFDSSDEQYTEVLYKWLQSGVTPTIRKLIEALESNMVKENNLAARLRYKYVARRSSQQGERMSLLCFLYYIHGQNCCV